MTQPAVTGDSRPLAEADWLWAAIVEAAEAAPALDIRDQVVTFGWRSEGAPRLHEVPPSDASAVLRWAPGAGWAPLAATARESALCDLYLPLCAATPSRPLVIGHLGQSLDGFIATASGDSQFVTGHENIVHLHRLRALCQAVVVGAGTVAADDPLLTTRYVEGGSPLRVVLDPSGRLDARYRVFADSTVPTICVRARSHTPVGMHRVGAAAIVLVDDVDGEVDAARVVELLRARGCYRIFVEGGGVTVSHFLERGLLDRLHVAVAPLLIGEGRPAIRLAPRPLLRDCLRPSHRVFRMGGDVCFDFDLRATAAADRRVSGGDIGVSAGDGGVARIL